MHDSKNFTVGHLVVLVFLGVVALGIGWMNRNKGQPLRSVPDSVGPETAGRTNVYTIKLGTFSMSSEATKIADAITEWLTAHPNETIIEIVRCSGESGSALVIVAHTKDRPK